MNTMDNRVVRINVTVPKKLLSELEKTVPERGKSGFVSEAIAEKLVREKRVKALKELAKLPATFTDIKDGAEYVVLTREQEDKERSKSLGL